MINCKKKVRALGLCSGGLDSILSALILRKQQIEVEWISFETPFFSSLNAVKASKMTGIPLTVRNITEEYMEMLKSPHCGYGKNMNPCIDCHSLMFAIAGRIMKEKNIDFLFSGEVLGQRPMSQTSSSLRYVEKHSGYEGYIVRPLSAKRLPAAAPEKEGLVDRGLLLDITGKSRKAQIALAAEFGISDYPAPAGGCLLTNREYSKRLKDLFAYQENYSENELHLLKFGRHFRINKKTKIIVGRNQSDNENIEKLFNPSSDIILKIRDFPGPLAIIPNGGSLDAVMLAASICAGYSKAQELSQIDVSVRTPDSSRIIKVFAIPPDKIRHLMIQQ